MNVAEYVDTSKRYA